MYLLPRVQKPTNFQNNDPSKVLDGELQPFLNSYLMSHGKAK